MRHRQVPVYISIYIYIYIHTQIPRTVASGFRVIVCPYLGMIVL